MRSIFPPISNNLLIISSLPPPPHPPPPPTRPPERKHLLLLLIRCQWIIQTISTIPGSSFVNMVMMMMMMAGVHNPIYYSQQSTLSVDGVEMTIMFLLRRASSASIFLSSLFFLSPAFYICLSSCEVYTLIPPPPDPLPPPPKSTFICFRYRFTVKLSVEKKTWAIFCIFFLKASTMPRLERWLIEADVDWSRREARRWRHGGVTQSVSM